MLTRPPFLFFFFFFNDTATTEIYTLSLHDALPISKKEHDDRYAQGEEWWSIVKRIWAGEDRFDHEGDRKSTRLNSSHGYISYAVFCLKKKKKEQRVKNDTQFRQGVFEHAEGPEAGD